MPSRKEAPAIDECVEAKPRRTQGSAEGRAYSVSFRPASNATPSRMRSRLPARLLRGPVIFRMRAVYEKRFDFGNPLGGKRPASLRFPIQSRRSALPTVQLRPELSVQVSPSCRRNTRASEMPPLLIALQPYARTAPHLGDLADRKDDELAIFPDGRDVVPIGRQQKRGARGRAQIEKLLGPFGSTTRSRRRARRSPGHPRQRRATGFPDDKARR